MGSNHDFILRTLAYSDVFDYPLTSKELWHFLISNKRIERSLFEKRLKKLPSKIVVKKEFYCFFDRVSIVDKRVKRNEESEHKLSIVKKLISYLSFLPTVYLIGISGTLAMKNSGKKDDIDLFIITKKNTLWTTRLFLTLFLEVLGYRRKRCEKNVEDKICLNFLIEEDILCLPKEKQNLYGAHEVVQMLPVFERYNMYNKFINANQWVNRFLPNTITIKKLINEEIKDRVERYTYITQLLTFSNFLAKKFQLWYMEKHRTKEIISGNFLAFHPIDYKDKVLSAYKKRLKKYGRI